MKHYPLLALLCGLLVVLSCAGCGDRSDVASHGIAGDSLLQQAYHQRDYARLLVLADSLQTTDQLAGIEANYWRGYASYRQHQARAAEYYWTRAVNEDIHSETDLRYYARSASHLTTLLLLKADYEGTLKTAMPAVKEMQQRGYTSIGEYGNLLTAIANCQLHLGRTDEAAANYAQAYDYSLRALTSQATGDAYKSAIVGVLSTTDNYLTVKDFAVAEQWTGRFEDLLHRYEAFPQVDSVFLDKSWARLNLYRASALEGLGKQREALESYRRAMTTQYAQTGDGRIEASDYLLAAHRWQDAANNFTDLDAQMQRYDSQYTLDNIQHYLLPKFRANVGAHRRDSAIAVGLQLCGLLDSAIAWQKRDDAAELATIYDTQDKEARIVQQQADLSRQRWISTLVALLLLSVFFAVYTYHKRKSTRRLAVAHEKLQTAYDQLEKTTTAKERIESELRIARDIQMSMVPSAFPDHPAFDLYASMMPAKEVGGDLYDFLLTDDQLYFCVGDVSGKGVPASLFMAQTTRLFRALAKEGRLPADIANRINAELVENNESGMFVTMFIGLVNLQTGHLYFCNAGHNPPVISSPSGRHTPEGGIVYAPRFLQMEPNAPIGLWPDLEYVGEELDDIRRQLLLVYTDGLNEAENREQEQLGDQLLLDMLTLTHYESCRQAIDAFRHAVDVHRDGALPNDDLTMLCLYLR